MNVPFNKFPVPIIQALLDLGIDTKEVEVITTPQVVVGLPEFPLETPFVSVYNRDTGFIWIETPDPAMLHEVRTIPERHVVIKGVQEKWAVAYANKEEAEWLQSLHSSVE